MSESKLGSGASRSSNLSGKITRVYTVHSLFHEFELVSRLKGAGVVFLTKNHEIFQYEMKLS